jgi:DNA mismatch endonuclease (patch repair protein)
VADVFSRAKRSEVMSGIRGKDTKPEIRLRRGLFARGFRYRLHSTKLPGRPDLVFPKFNSVVFVNGCFWHGHECHLFKWPSDNAEFWRTKITRNVQRDRSVLERVVAASWRAMTVWECEVRADPEAAVARVADWLRLEAKTGAPERGAPVVEIRRS